jgi:hypothetical protein
MQDISAGPIVGDPTEDPELPYAGDEESGDWSYGDIAQNEQIATPDGPMSREEVEVLEDDGLVMTIDYLL